MTYSACDFMDDLIATLGPDMAPVPEEEQDQDADIEAETNRAIEAIEKIRSDRDEAVDYLRMVASSISVAPGVKAAVRDFLDRIDAKPRTETPPCAAFMGCLCAGHARGNPACDPCDTSE